MSISRETTVWCDTPEDEKPYGCAHHRQTIATNAHEARQIVKRRGWTREGKLDFCRVCSADRI